MAVLFGRYHLFDRLDLGARQLLWRRSRARGGVVETALILAFPRMVPRLRQPKYAQHGSQRKNGTRSIDCSKQRDFRRPIGEPDTGEREARYFQQDDHEPKHRNEAFDAFAKSQYFLLEADDVHIDNVKSDNLRRRRGEPTASRGPGNTLPSCVSDVTRRSDKIAKAMIVASLNSSRGSHDSIMTVTAPAATPSRAEKTQG